jgi:AcrR family transcriptional regulator
MSAAEGTGGVGEFQAMTDDPRPPPAQARPAAPDRHDAATRPLRRDAEENRRRILRGASRIFSERGLGVSMEDIATASGVGVGTLYRRFSDREQLLEALFDAKIDDIVNVADEAMGLVDPWLGLVQFAHRAIEMQVADRGLAEILHGREASPERIVRIRERIAPAVERLVRRAQASGDLRNDVNAVDMALIQLMVTTVAEQVQPVAPDAWRRSLTIVLDGLRTRRDGTAPMPHPLLDADQLEAVLHGERHGG